MSTTKFNPETEIGSLAGKIILVTGGSSGLGKETIFQLAKHSPQKIYLAARNETKSLDAIQAIKSASLPDAEIEWVPCDMASLDSIRKAAQSVRERSPRLDILILNAGIMATPPEKSATGHDLQLATNHIGHFLLTKELIPLLEKTAAEPNSDVRVITLSSEAYSLSPSVDKIMETEKLSAAGPWERYGASKAANILFAAELARRHPSLTSVSLHPGMIKTDLWKHDDQSHSLMKYFMLVVGPFIYKTPEEGAHNQLYLAAAARRASIQNGAYYTPVGKVKSSNKFATNVGGGKAFWDWTEAELRKAGY